MDAFALLGIGSSSAYQDTLQSCTSFSADLLDDEEFLNESAIQNPNLMKLVTNVSSLENLFSIALEGNEKRGYKACEFLCLCLDQVFELILTTDGMLHRCLLHPILDASPPLSPLCAVHFTKIIIAFIRKDRKRTMASLRSFDGFGSSLAAHTPHTPKMAEIVHVMREEEKVDPSGVEEWLVEQGYIRVLLSCIASDVYLANAATGILFDMVEASASEPSHIISHGLCTEDAMQSILKFSLARGRCGIVNGLGLVRQVLEWGTAHAMAVRGHAHAPMYRIRIGGDGADVLGDDGGVGTEGAGADEAPPATPRTLRGREAVEQLLRPVFQQVNAVVPDLMELIHSGTRVEEPFGSHRLEALMTVVSLLQALRITQSDASKHGDELFSRSKLIDAGIELVLARPCCNVAHHSVLQLFRAVWERPAKFPTLQSEMVQESIVLDRVAVALCKEAEKPPGMRLPHAGHLLEIALGLEELKKDDADVSSALQACDKWREMCGGPLEQMKEERKTSWGDHSSLPVVENAGPLNVDEADVGGRTLPASLTREVPDPSEGEDDMAARLQAVEAQVSWRLESAEKGAEKDEQDVDLFGTSSNHKEEVDLFGTTKKEKEEVIDLFGTSSNEKEEVDLFGTSSNEKEEVDLFGKKQDEKEEIDLFGTTKNIEKKEIDLFGTTSENDGEVTDFFGSSSPKNPSVDLFGSRSDDVGKVDLFSRPSPSGEHIRSAPVDDVSVKDEDFFAAFDSRG